MIRLFDFSKEAVRIFFARVSKIALIGDSNESVELIKNRIQIWVLIAATIWAAFKFISPELIEWFSQKWKKPKLSVSLELSAVKKTDQYSVIKVVLREKNDSGRAFYSLQGLLQLYGTKMVPQTISKENFREETISRVLDRPTQLGSHRFFAFQLHEVIAVERLYGGSDNLLIREDENEYSEFTFRVPKEFSEVKVVYLNYVSKNNETFERAWKQSKEGFFIMQRYESVEGKRTLLTGQSDEEKAYIDKKGLFVIHTESSLAL